MNSVQYFQKVTPYVRRQGTTTISSKLVNVQPMTPPSGKLYFADSLGMTAEEIDVVSGNLFIVFLSDSLIQGAYFEYDQAKAIKDSDPDNINIIPTWLNTDNYKLSRKIYVLYSDSKGVSTSRIENKIDFIESLYKYRATLVFNPDPGAENNSGKQNVSYAVESCTANPSFDILTDLPNWTAKYGTPYH